MPVSVTKNLWDTRIRLSSLSYSCWIVNCLCLCYFLILGRLVTGIVGSNPIRVMDVCLCVSVFLLSFVGRDFCDGLITRPEESYHVFKYRYP
jgi:hypothetical protein